MLVTLKKYVMLRLQFGAVNFKAVLCPHSTIRDFAVLSTYTFKKRSIKNNDQLACTVSYLRGEIVMCALCTKDSCAHDV